MSRQVADHKVYEKVLAMWRKLEYGYFLDNIQRAKGSSEFAKMNRSHYLQQARLHASNCFDINGKSLFEKSEIEIPVVEKKKIEQMELSL